MVGADFQSDFHVVALTPRVRLTYNGGAAMTRCHHQALDCAAMHCLCGGITLVRQVAFYGVAFRTLVVETPERGRRANHPTAPLVVVGHLLDLGLYDLA